MISANTKILTDEGPIKANDLEKSTKVLCIDKSHSSYYNEIREPWFSTGKLYNFYFAGGILASTEDQRVLCVKRRLMTICEALITKTPIHTASGLLLPHFIENSSQKAEVVGVKPVGWDNNVFMVESVYLL